VANGRYSYLDEWAKLMNPTKDDFLRFLIGRGSFDWAVTINLMKRHPRYQTYITPEIFEKTGRHYLALVNKRIFKRQYQYGHIRLNSIFCMEYGEHKRPHLHFAIGSPPQTDKDSVLAELYRSYKLMDWVKGEVHITPYHSSVWINYILKTGFESIAIH